METRCPFIPISYAKKVATLVKCVEDLSVKWPYTVSVATGNWSSQR